jgi:CDP-alcohol phosphatidyltransferase
MKTGLKYSYRESVKSDASDELINIYLQRPIAGLLTQLLFYTPATPNQVTIFSTLCGIAGGIFLGLQQPSLALAGVLFYMKDILDSADGQLARAKQLYSRRGRFLDSIGDFIVNIFLFGGIVLASMHSGESMLFSLILGCVGFLGLSMRVSYHVFYQVSYLHFQNKYLNNRENEELREEDLHGDKLALLLQKIYLVLYGWQDALIQKIDRWSSGGEKKFPSSRYRVAWYSDPTGLRLNGLIGLGTEFVTLAICFFCGELRLYLLFTVIIYNVLWGLTIIYRKWILSPILRKQS